MKETKTTTLWSTSNHPHKYLWYKSKSDLQEKKTPKCDYLLDV